MKLPPLWKIHRELRRFGRQLITSPGHVAHYLLATPYYDHFLARKSVETTGLSPETSKVAIYLIFPQYGVKKSHIRALEYLGASGYAPLVVSNLPLTATDREKVLSRCWRLIERPNFGYDFGGYRDGIIALKSRLARLHRLVLLNDSCWFPLPGANNWLMDAESLGRDFVGACSHYGMRSPDVENFRTIHWNYNSTNRNFHYTSFALSIGPRILHSGKFYAFWKRFPLSTEKVPTVKRGEFGLTRWAIQSGYSHGSTLDVGCLADDLATVSSERLREITKNLITPAIRRLRSVRSTFLQSDDASSNKSHIALILTGVARQGASYALADYLIRDKGFSFLKKSPLWLDEESSDISLSLIRQLPEPEQSELMEEALELRARKAQVPEETRAK